MANITYADSGAGWLVDKRFYKEMSGLIATINERSYHTTKNGAVVFATVYLPTGYTGPVVIAQDETLAAYDQGNTKSQGSFEYMGYTWYVSAFRYWIVGDFPDTSGISQKLSLDTSDYEEVGKAILDAASIIREEDFTTTIDRIYYNGKSKVIKRICQLINQFTRLGLTHENSFYGDWGMAAYEHSLVREGNPHNVTADDLGLGKVQDQINSILEEIGVMGDWIDSASAGEGNEPEYIVDHDGDYIELRAIANILVWH